MFIIRQVFWVLLLVTAISYGLLASRTTSPGEWLYPGKILGDQIEYRLTPTNSGKVQLKLDWLAQKSVAIKKDNLAQNPAQAAVDSQDFKNLTGQIQNDIKKIQDSGKDVTDLNLTLRAILASCNLSKQ